MPNMAVKRTGEKLRFAPLSAIRLPLRSSALRADERGASCRTAGSRRERRRTLVRASPLRGDCVVPSSRPDRPRRFVGTPTLRGRGGRSAPGGMTLNSRPVRRLHAYPAK